MSELTDDIQVHIEVNGQRVWSGSPQEVEGLVPGIAETPEFYAWALDQLTPQIESWCVYFWDRAEHQDRPLFADRNRGIEGILWFSSEASAVEHAKTLAGTPQSRYQDVRVAPREWIEARQVVGDQKGVRRIV